MAVLAPWRRLDDLVASEGRSTEGVELAVEAAPLVARRSRAREAWDGVVYHARRAPRNVALVVLELLPFDLKEGYYDALSREDIGPLSIASIAGEFLTGAIAARQGYSEAASLLVADAVARISWEASRYRNAVRKGIIKTNADAQGNYKPRGSIPLEVVMVGVHVVKAAYELADAAASELGRAASGVYRGARNSVRR